MSGLEVVRIEDGLWWWGCAHPAWRPGASWDQVVGSTYLEAPDATVVIDPLVPAGADGAERFHSAFDRDVARRGVPVVVAITCAWHARSAFALAARHGGTLWLPPGVPDAPPHEALADGREPAAGLVARALGTPPGHEEFAFVVAARDAVVVGDVIRTPGGRPEWAPPEDSDDTPALAAWFADRRRRVGAVLPDAPAVLIAGHGLPATAGVAAALAAMCAPAAG